MKFRKLFNELRRRNVLKSIIAYLAVSWVIIQIGSIVLPAFNAPDYALKVLIIILSIGLIFWTGFSWIYDLTPSGFQKTEDIVEQEETMRVTSRRLNKVIAGSLLIAVLLLISISFWAGSKWQDSQLNSTSFRIAVIPFDIDQENTDDIAHLKTGLTEALISELSKVDALNVLGLASAELLSSEISPANLLILNEIKRVDYFISGKVERLVNTMNIEVEMRKSINDEQALWQKRYTGDIAEINQLLAEAASDLATEMGIEVPLEDSYLWTNLRQVRPETYELYLKGKHYLNKSTPAEFQRGMAFLQQAIDENPADPDAYAGLAEGYVTLGHGPDPPPDVFPKALSAAQRAIQLDSLNAEGWAALAHYHTYFGMDWKMAEYAFEKANRLNPNMAYNHYHRSWYYVLYGHMNEAIAEHKRAQELDPFTPLHTAFLGEIYRMVGEYEKGLEELDKVSYMNDPLATELVIRGLIYIDQGRVDEGLQLLKKGYEIFPAWKYWGYGIAVAQLGRIEEAEKVIAELEAAPATAFGALCLGMMYAELGKNDKAMKWLNYESKHGWFPWIRIYIKNESMRQDSRFLKLIDDMNLPHPRPLRYDPEK